MKTDLADTISLASDMMQNQLAFNAFASTVINILLTANITTPQTLSQELKTSASVFRENKAFKAAMVLDELVQFIIQREQTLLKALSQPPTSENIQ